MIKTIHVTQEQIDDGERMSPYRCPIAHAAGQSVARPVAVSARFIRFGTGDLSGNLISVKLPNEALEFISRFDNGFSVTAFSFSLEIPDELLRKDVTNA